MSRCVFMIMCVYVHPTHITVCMLLFASLLTEISLSERTSAFTVLRTFQHQDTTYINIDTLTAHTLTHTDHRHRRRLSISLLAPFICTSMRVHEPTCSEWTGQLANR